MRPHDRSPRKREDLTGERASRHRDDKNPGPRPRVLAAVDGADLRDELKCLLHGRCDVKVVGDGDAALASIRNDSPDLVLAGVSMPSLDGLGLLRAIRAYPATRSIPAILLAAWDGEADRAEVFECGADDYLAKPFGVRELSARLAAHVELAHLRKEMAGRTTAVESIRHVAELSHAILSSLRDHVAVLDEDGVIITVNEAWARSTGDRGLVRGVMRRRSLPRGLPESRRGSRRLREPSSGGDRRSARRSDALLRARVRLRLRHRTAMVRHDGHAVKKPEEVWSSFIGISLIGGD